ncbi:MAG: ABC transporter ATP-binding protein [Lentisphaerae bacterium]|nr:ABC transporter ATP-binding protein [Lentisphaerota bacterium]
MSMPVLEIRGATKAYPGPAGGEPVVVLRGLDLVVAAGEAVAILGPSGSGKSTLLNLAGALDRPTSGAVLLEGRDLASLPDDDLARVRNRSIGFVFQQHHLLPQLTVLENVLLPVLADRAAGLPVDRAMALLDRVGLGPRVGHRPAQLSGGECQRVAVVRALVNTPRLVLADEPTGALDARTAAALGDLLVDLNRAEGVALVTVTHSPALAARMGRRLRLDGGALRPDPDPVT